jgi:hypothetical protein
MTDSEPKATPHQLAVALMSALVTNDEGALLELTAEATRDREVSAGVIGALMLFLRIEANWHAGQVEATTMQIIEGFGALAAQLPYGLNEPPDDFEGWAPDE